MKNIVIVHFAPLELYPPVQNLLKELAKKEMRSSILVITTRPIDVGSNNLFAVNSKAVTIIRLGASGRKDNRLRRYMGYLYFYTACLMLLCWYRPKRILYFETLSSWPVYFFKRFLKRNTEILIHYHEYTSPMEYQDGMWLSSFFHRRERWLYSRSIWVSHTNRQRMDFFVNDIKPISIPNPQILPNYPPQSWFIMPKEKVALPMKIIYVGALSLDTMFTREFAQWVLSWQGKVIWDIYSSNYAANARQYLEGLGSEFIHFYEGVNYDQLPSLLRKYDVGVILYNGHIPNYVYNAPNKLFEYLACGLDIWFPDVLKSSLPLVTTQTYPQVVALDFKTIPKVDPENLFAREGLTLQAYPYFCEEVLQPLIHKLTEP
ncbi:MAG: hypothetical protein JST69_00660 [Bacteroidetes bacterium]|nr:hypothetical protein [Bacteroidota bacterium]